jgi:hypothetical protein
MLFKLVNNLVAFQAKHDQVGKPISIYKFSKFVIATRATASLPNHMGDIRNTDNLIANFLKKWFIARRILAKASTLSPELTGRISGYSLTRNAHSMSRAVVGCEAYR